MAKKIVNPDFEREFDESRIEDVTAGDDAVLDDIGMINYDDDGDSVGGGEADVDGESGNQDNYADGKSAVKKSGEDNATADNGMKELYIEPVADKDYIELIINFRRYKLICGEVNIVPAHVYEYYISLNRDITRRHREQNRISKDISRN